MAETLALGRVLEPFGLETDDLILERARKHPTFLLRCHWENHFEVQAVQRFPEIRGRILDFGCGSGHLTTMLAEKDLFVDGVDISPVAISVAKYVASRSLAKRVPNFVCGDIAKMTVAPLYDACWASHVFEHIKDPDTIMQGIKRCLVPGGKILIAVPLGHNFDDPDHVHHWKTPEEFQEFFSPFMQCERGEIDMETGCLRGVFTFL